MYASLPPVERSARGRWFSDTVVSGAGSKVRSKGLRMYEDRESGSCSAADIEVLLVNLPGLGC